MSQSRSQTSILDVLEFIVIVKRSCPIIATLPTAEIIDDMLFDPESKRIYVACDEFVVR